MRYVCLLRAINVSGHNVIRSAALAAVFTELGYSNVRTYIQSGNVLFDAPRSKDHANRIQVALANVGIETVAFIRTATQLKRIIAEDPFDDDDKKRQYVVFLDRRPTKKLGELPAAKGERLELTGDVAYLLLPHGAAKTKLNVKFIEKRLNRFGTSRNWNTVNKLLALCDGS